MTPKSLKIVHLVHAYWFHHQMGPTLNELCVLTETKSKSVIHFRVQSLIRNGWLSKTERERRGIFLTQKGLALCKKNVYIEKPPPAPGEHVDRKKGVDTGPSTPLNVV